MFLLLGIINHKLEYLEACGFLAYYFLRRKTQDKLHSKQPGEEGHALPILTYSTLSDQKNELLFDCLYFFYHH